MLLSMVLFVNACGGVSQSEVDAQIEEAVQAALAEAQARTDGEETLPEVQVTESTTTTSSTLPCTESARALLTSSREIEVAADTASQEVLGRDLNQQEKNSIVGDVHDLQRLHAVRVCEYERGQRAELQELSWELELPSLIYTRWPTQADAYAKAVSSASVLCWMRGEDPDCYEE